MKFTTNTKPLMDGLNLAIIDANISNFYQKSTMAQLKVDAESKSLIINLEAASIVSQLTLKGQVELDENTTTIAFVSSQLLKKLISTIETQTVTFDLAESGLIIHSGKSKFTLPHMLDDTDIEFDAPSNESTSDNMVIDKSGWKFVKDYQMYAIALSFIHKVYTRVYVGAKGDILVGDFDNGLFTHSNKAKLGRTCLLTDTIVNLFNTLPEGATICENDRNYIVKVTTDSYNFKAEFIPEYEDDEEVGSYNSDIIIDMMKNSGESIAIKSGNINKILGQATLLSSASEDKISFIYQNGVLNIKDKNVDCIVPFEGKINRDFSIDFKTALLKPVISNASGDDLKISPVFEEDSTEVSGLLIESDGLKVLIAGVE